MPAGQPLINELWVENSTGVFYIIDRVTPVLTGSTMVEVVAVGEPTNRHRVYVGAFLHQCTYVEPPPYPQPASGMVYAVSQPEYVGAMPPRVDDHVQDLGTLAGVGTDNIRVGVDVARTGAADLTLVMLREAVRRDSDAIGINPMEHPTVNHALFVALVQASEGHTYQDFIRALSPAYQEVYRDYLVRVAESMGKAPPTQPENPSLWDRLEREDA